MCKRLLRRWIEARSFVITAGGGLIPPETLFTIDMLREISAVPIEAKEARYREPLERDAWKLRERIGAACDVVLLGSVATPKYVEPLLGIFGERLMFPAEFAGRGDMSRGGLMLRCARSGEELTYVPVATAVRHGPRPPKLAKLAKLPKLSCHAMLPQGCSGLWKRSSSLAGKARQKHLLRETFLDTHVRINLDVLRPATAKSSFWRRVSLGTVFRGRQYQSHAGRIAPATDAGARQRAFA